ncbi:hypothetical protein [Sinomonas sp. G460-2]|uniref:hypothetical protein n=1 Tax=Sinomonas sp. G460-2 TaxID=3393464 RepID=UPI0039EE11A1
MTSSQPLQVQVPPVLPLADPDKLRQDLSAEYQALIRTMSDVDGRLMTVKGWSVTLSLAGLGLGFQYGHWALFGLGALSAAAFWTIEALMKGHQLRYYVRMREIEVAMYSLNQVQLPDGTVASAPRTDWDWDQAAKGVGARPLRRTEGDVKADIRTTWIWPHVFLPHVAAVAVGVVLFVLGFTGLLHIAP